MAAEIHTDVGHSPTIGVMFASVTGLDHEGELRELRKPGKPPRTPTIKVLSVIAD